MARRLSVLCLLAALTACATQPAPAPAPAPVPAPKPAPAAAQEKPTTGLKRTANAWTINQEGLAIIESAEGLRLSAYQLAGQWLIGYGHARGVTAGMTITKAQAEQFLRQDVSLCEGSVAAAVTEPITQNEFSAMVSLCYNIGHQTFERSSVVMKLNAGDHGGAADAFLGWNKAKVNGVKTEVPYLTARRQKERALFLKEPAATS
ncbi:MAG TPA: lysozyme [Alphaproteobacteria bacterium]|nr:lysozyme [Alphaproteobacteria bacterium]